MNGASRIGAGAALSLFPVRNEPPSEPRACVYWHSGFLSSDDVQHRWVVEDAQTAIAAGLYSPADDDGPTIRLTLACAHSATWWCRSG